MTRPHRALRVAGGVAGGLGVAAAAVAITASAAGVQFHGGSQYPVVMAALAPVTVVATPAPFSVVPTPQAPAPPMRTVAGTALVQAEARVLGIPVRQLTMNLKQGTTLSQMAAPRSLTAAQFGARVAQQVQPQLDQQVAGQQLTGAQEQTLLKQLQSGQVPNWSTVPKPN